MVRYRRQQLDEIDCVSRIQFDPGLQVSTFGGMLKEKAMKDVHYLGFFGRHLSRELSLCSTFVV